MLQAAGGRGRAAVLAGLGHGGPALPSGGWSGWAEAKRSSTPHTPHTPTAQPAARRPSGSSTTRCRRHSIRPWRRRAGIRPRCGSTDLPGARQAEGHRLGHGARSGCRTARGSDHPLRAKLPPIDPPPEAADAGRPGTGERTHRRVHLAHSARRRSALLEPPAARALPLPRAFPGLYLCGAGQHPGGEISGIPGHNAAQEVIRDLA